MGTAYSKLKKTLLVLFRLESGNLPIECTDRGEDDQCLQSRSEEGARQLHSPRDEHDGGWCGWMSENGCPITHPTDEVQRNNWIYITTEFWKSNARKFCEFCRVWFADNKSSIDFHERGKKHQENVQRKLGQLRKKGLKQHEEQQHTKSYLQQMEEDALKAFKKDAQKDSSLVSQYNQAAVEYKVRQYQEQQEHEPKPTKQQEGTWYEGKNEDGYSYYWNDVTGVSQWEQPATFVPLQAETSSEKETSEEKKKEKSQKTDDADSEDDEEDDKKDDDDDEKEEKTNRENTTEKESTQKGQKRKSDAYGGWTEVVEEDSTPVDLQLPESAQNYISQYQPQVEQRQPKEEVEFGTKTITSLGSASSSSGGPVGFKKRKVKGGARSLRQRDGSS